MMERAAALTLTAVHASILSMSTMYMLTYA